MRDAIAVFVSFIIIAAIAYMAMSPFLKWWIEFYPILKKFF